MKRLEINARVLTVKTDNPSTDWQEGARVGCRYGIQGQVVRVSDSHGLCYFVRHIWNDQSEDGSHIHRHAWYDPDELIEVTDDDIATLLQEAAAARRRISGDAIVFRRASPRERWDEVK